MITLDEVVTGARTAAANDGKDPDAAEKIVREEWNGRYWANQRCEYPGESVHKMVTGPNTPIIRENCGRGSLESMKRQLTSYFVPRGSNEVIRVVRIPHESHILPSSYGIVFGDAFSPMSAREVAEVLTRILARRDDRKGIFQLLTRMMGNTTIGE